jgi:methanogenic corrinoid protein MtbC1
MMPNVLEEISFALSDLRSPEKLLELINSALAANIPAIDVVEKGLRSGLQKVGQKYENGEFFLAELLFAASNLNQAMQTLRPTLSAQTQNKKGTIVLGTVRGDIHDVGKNIFKLMAESAGFSVTDVGVDVDPESFVQESQRLRPALLGLSCLLTTGLPEIKVVIERLGQAKMRDNLKVLIGGNAVTKEFAKQVGADAAALDAVQGVEFCRGVIKA